MDYSTSMNIDVNNYKGNTSEIIFQRRLKISPQDTLTISIDSLDQKNIGFAILQLHSYRYTLKLWYQNPNDSKDDNFQEGNNIGLSFNTDSSSKKVYVKNQNDYEVIFMVVLIAYPHSAPIPGSCLIDVDSQVSPTIEIEEMNHFITARIPFAQDSSGTCENLTYETYYSYINPLNFEMDSYFDVIEKMMFTNIFDTYPVRYNLNFLT